MTEFTQEQLNQLAVFAGLTVGPNENWYYCNTSSAQMLMFCRRQEWLPHLKPEQADLVLKTLVEIHPDSFVLIGLGSKRVWCNTRTEKTTKGDWWPEAVCLVALEILEGADK